MPFCRASRSTTPDRPRRTRPPIRGASAATDFMFGGADWEYMDNCFCLGYRTGFHFKSFRPHPAHPGPWAPNMLITNSGPDESEDIAVLADDSQDVMGISSPTARSSAGSWWRTPTWAASPSTPAISRAGTSVAREPLPCSPTATASPPQQRLPFHRRGKPSHQAGTGQLLLHRHGEPVPHRPRRGQTKSRLRRDRGQPPGMRSRRTGYRAQGDSPAISRRRFMSTLRRTDAARRS